MGQKTTPPSTDEEDKDDKLAKKVAEGIQSMPAIKKKKEEIRRNKEIEGLDFFFGNRDNFILASEDDFEGHYPGNQNNVVLIPHKRQPIHVTKAK